MAPVARNHPCPCGSGKKYKLCCLGRQEAEQRAAREAQLQARRDAQWRQHYRFVTDDPLTNLSNDANDLIRAGRLDEAEPLCRRLREDYPDEIDGPQRTAQLLEARGDKRAAAACLREALAMALTQDGFEEESYRRMRDQISRLEAG